MIEPMLQFFAFEHLPAGPLRDMSRKFFTLAIDVVEHAPRNSERTMALRKLLEAKDCAVRSLLYQPEDPAPGSDPAFANSFANAQGFGR